MVIDVSRATATSNYTASIPSFFIKQIQNWEPQAVATLQCEATCYWLAQSDSDLSGLALLTPRYHLYDPSRHILITELLPEAENLSDYHRRLSKFPVEIAVKIGSALGTYHRENIDKLKEVPQSAHFQSESLDPIEVIKNSQLFGALSAANSRSSISFRLILNLTSPRRTAPPMAV